MEGTVMGSAVDVDCAQGVNYVVKTLKTPFNSFTTETFFTYIQT